MSLAGCCWLGTGCCQAEETHQSNGRNRSSILCFLKLETQLIVRQGGSTVAMANNVYHNRLLSHSTTVKPTDNLQDLEEKGEEPSSNSQ
ncbi:hypothetical protein F7725_012034 [Dissostichus mawsoni]|uniref:Uncharacterized protein n=1 Tax=Dissostichus mawsoni TaxID=36200 RepID=A0A7J5ZB96_DISMA|nr:hypothetical protein F7725_012034 [Dissostichus mawsoni]